MNLELARTSDCNTRQQSREDFLLKTNRHTKKNETFFHRTKLLHNIVTRAYDQLGEHLYKQTMGKKHWDHFVKISDFQNKRTWKALCKC